MSQEQLQSFLAQAKGDINLQSQLKKAVDIQAVEAIAKNYGCDVTTRRMAMLSNQDLESVAGGVTNAGTICSMATCHC